MEKNGRLFCQCCNKYVSVEASAIKRHLGILTQYILCLDSMQMDKDTILQIIEIIHWQKMLYCLCILF